jgi:S-(hydroxymethyl)glutathione dehydrogenase/alcohol dehydrogenase
MKAAVLHSYGEPLKVEDVTLAPPNEGEVKVKIEATGVCHSDLSVKNGTLGFPAPCVPGHEAAGTITEVGKDVADLAEGDRVIVRWIPSCGECWYCTHGEPVHCNDIAERHGLMKDMSTRLSLGDMPLFHGLDAATFAEEAILGEKAVYKIPDDLPFDAAAVMGCAVGTGVGAVINTAKVKEGDRVAVIGCGGVGVNIVQGARIAGAEQIIAVDTVASKLEAAQKFGATDVVNASETNPSSAIRDLTQGVGVDYAFEAIGNTKVQESTMEMIRRGGYSVLVGVSPFGEQFPVTPAIMTLTGRSLLGSYFGDMVTERDFPKLIDWWREGKLDLEGLITGTGTLEDINSIFEEMEAGTILRKVIKP